MFKRLISTVLVASLAFSFMGKRASNANAEAIDLAYFTACAEPNRLYDANGSLNTYLADNTDAKTYFASNICFLADSTKLWVNNGKYRAGKATKLVSGVLYIPVETLAALTGVTYSIDGTSVTISNVTLTLGSNQLHVSDSVYDMTNVAFEELGTVYVPAEEYCTYALSKGYSLSSKGLAVFGDKDVSGTNNSTMSKEMLNYLAFDRPTAAAIQKTVTAHAHPRIFATEAEISNALALSTTDTNINKWSNAALTKARSLVNGNYGTITTDSSGHLSGWCDSTCVMPLYWAYRKTGYSTYANKAINWVYNMATTSADWYEKSSFLNNGNVAYTCALVYDLFYDYMTENNMSDKRDVIAEQIKQRSLLIAQQEYSKKLYSDWPKRENNWNLVCNADMIASAVAIMDYDPSLCSDVIAHALVSMETAMPSYSADGGWFEGIGYWEYSTENVLNGICALDTACGTDYGITEVPGFLKTGQFLIDLNGSKYPFEYHDVQCGNVINSAPLMWLAKRNSDMNLQKYRVDQIDNYGSQNSVKDILWYTAATMPEAAKADLDALYPNAGAWTMRSDTSSSPVFVGMHAGANNASHSGLDIGDFEYEANGVKFASSLGKDNDSLDGIYTTSNGQRYTYYANRAEGQNVYVVNPSSDGGQIATATATVKQIKASTDESAYVVNMTSAYKNQVQMALRGYKLTNNRKEFVLQDEITPNRAGDSYYWFWHTFATIGIDDTNNIVTLTRNGETVKLYFECNVPLTLSAGNAAPMTDMGSPNPSGQLQMSYQTGMKKIIANFQAESTDTVTLRVSVIADGSAYEAKTIVPISDWGGASSDIDFETEYTIDNLTHTISGVKKYTTVDDFLANLTDLKGNSAWVYNDGKLVTSGYIKDGYTLKVGDEANATSLQIKLDDDIIGSDFDSISYNKYSWKIIDNKFYAGGYASGTANSVELATSTAKGGNSLKLCTGGSKPTNGNTQVTTVNPIPANSGNINVEFSIMCEDTNLQRVLIAKDTSGNWWNNFAGFNTSSKLTVFSQEVMTYTTNKWYNVVLTIDTSNKVCDVYVNGKLAKSGIKSSYIRNDIAVARIEAQNVVDVSSVTWVDDFRIYETGTALSYDKDYEDNVIVGDFSDSKYAIDSDAESISGVKAFTRIADFRANLGAGFSQAQLSRAGKAVTSGYIKDGDVVTLATGDEYTVVLATPELWEDFDAVNKTSWHITSTLDASGITNGCSVEMGEDDAKGGRSVVLSAVTTSNANTKVTTNSSYTYVDSDCFNVEFSVMFEDKKLKRQLVGKNSSSTWWLPAFVSFEKDGTVKFLNNQIATYEVGKWYDYVFAIDSANGIYSVYINGKCIISGASSTGLYSTFVLPRFEVINEENVASVAWFDDFKIYATGSSLGYEDTNTDYIQYIKLTDSNGNEITTPTGDEFNITVSVNSKSKTQPTVALVGVYDELGRLINAFATTEATVQGHAGFKATITGNDLQTKTIKLFLWDNAATMQPIVVTQVEN